MIRAIALVDLDDTLFQSRRKCPADVPEDRLTPLGFAQDGAALGFATPRQAQFIAWLGETSRMIPVTARSVAALRRVRIPFTAAICAHGGLILDADGRPDPIWRDRLAAKSARDRPVFERLAEAITSTGARMNIDLRVRILSEADLPLYVLAKHVRDDEHGLRAVVDAAVPTLPPGWTRHVNGNNAALLPPWLGKAHAVRHLLPHLRAEHPDLPVIGIGDSLTDAPFMRLCDFAMTPAGSQLGGALLGD